MEPQMISHTELQAAVENKYFDSTIQSRRREALKRT
jgi:hypothetical protein